MKLPHSAIVRAPGLLPMLYKTRELAEELGVARSRVVGWARAGAPHSRDLRGHIWIEGRAFANWLDGRRTRESDMVLAPQEAYCMRCNKPVQIQSPQRRNVGHVRLLTGSCPHCGATVNRGVRDGKP